MFSIGELAQHGRVSVRMLRHYDAIGLLRPACVDPVTGYRSCFGEVFAWLGSRGMAPSGAPFFRYNVIDMMAELEVDVAVPVATPVAGDGHMVSGVLPAGRYATLTHVGHPAELAGVTKSLLDWAAGQGLTWDMTQ